MTECILHTLEARIQWINKVQCMHMLQFSSVKTKRYVCNLRCKPPTRRLQEHDKSVDQSFHESAIHERKQANLTLTELVCPGTNQRARERKSLWKEMWGRRREESVYRWLHNGQPPTCSPTTRLQHTAQTCAQESQRYKARACGRGRQ